MKRTAVLLSALVLGACGPAEIVVTAELTDTVATGEAENRTLGDLEITVLPYDRDEIFDSLTAAAPTPQPEIPQELLEQQTQVATAQNEWRQAEARWGELRDSLQKVSEAMEGFSRGEARYVALFREFNEMDAELGTMERRMNTAFARFDSLQKAGIERATAVRLEREAWGDEAFADVDQVISFKVAEAGVDPVADTTDATGVARIEVDPGQYWVHARYELPYNELYWNVPVTAARGEPVQVRLTKENAEIRPKL